MKNSFKLFSILILSFFFINISYSQNNKVNEDQKNTQIASCKRIIQKNANKQEVEKAKKILDEYGVDYSDLTIKEEEIKSNNTEEQEHMSKTLSPEEYDLWKKNKHNNKNKINENPIK